jgi:hypothetical protein
MLVAWLPLLFSTAASILFGLYRKNLQAGDAASMALLEPIRLAVEAGVSDRARKLDALPYYQVWTAAMYVHACLAAAVATAAVYVTYVVFRSRAARSEERQGICARLLALGATWLTIAACSCAYGAFLLMQWCLPDRARFSSVVIELSGAEKIDAAFPSWTLCDFQSLLGYPAASLGAFAACLSLTLLRKPASLVTVDELKSCADHLRLLRVLTVGMLVVATLATGLWFQWPATLVKQPHAGSIIGLGGGATILASAIYTAGVASVYLPAEYILRLRVKAWLRLNPRMQQPALTSPASPTEQSAQLMGLPIGSMLESYREALSVLTPLIVGVAQALLTTK